jgi:hypothetical protein
MRRHVHSREVHCRADGTKVRGCFPKRFAQHFERLLDGWFLFSSHFFFLAGAAPPALMRFAE